MRSRFRAWSGRPPNFILQPLSALLGDLHIAQPQPPVRPAAPSGTRSRARARRHAGFAPAAVTRTAWDRRAAPRRPPLGRAPCPPPARRGGGRRRWLKCWEPAARRPHGDRRPEAGAPHRARHDQDGCDRRGGAGQAARRRLLARGAGSRPVHAGASPEDVAQKATVRRRPRFETVVRRSRAHLAPPALPAQGYVRPDRARSLPVVRFRGSGPDDGPAPRVAKPGRRRRPFAQEARFPQAAAVDDRERVARRRGVLRQALAFGLAPGGHATSRSNQD